MVKITKAELYEVDGLWRWTAYDKGGREMTSSSNGYDHKRWAHSIARALFPDAEIVERV